TGGRPRDGAEDHRLPDSTRWLRVRRRARRGAGHRPGEAGGSAPAGCAVRPQILVACLVAGLALADLARRRVGGPPPPRCSGAALVPRSALVAATLLMLGWWWGSVRLAQLDHTVLSSHVGEAARVHVVVTGPVRRGRFELRGPGLATRYDRRPVHEPVLLELA